MLEEILDCEGNVVSTRKRSIVQLKELANLTNYIIPKKEEYHGLSIRKKIVFSTIISLFLFYGLYKLNNHYKLNDIGTTKTSFHTTQCDYDASHCLVKNFDDGRIRINSLGFKGDEVTKEKPVDAYRIVVVGGSTSFNEYPKYLGELLNDRAIAQGKKIRFQVINGAISAYNSELILKRVIHDVIPLNPDMVVYGPEWNDVGSCIILSGEEQEIIDGFLMGQIEEERFKALGTWYTKHFNVFQKQRENYVENIKRKTVKTMQDLGSKVYLFKKMGKILELDFAGYRQIGLDSHMSDFSPDVTLTNLSKIFEICKNNNIKMAVVTTPDDFEDYSLPGIPPGCKVLFSNNDWYAYNRQSLNPSIRRIALENGVLLADLERDFNSADKKKYFKAGYITNGIKVEGEFMHFNNLGDSYIAEICLRKFWPYLKDLP